MEKLIRERRAKKNFTKYQIRDKSGFMNKSTSIIKYSLDFTSIKTKRILIQ